MFEIDDKTKKIIFIGLTILLFILFIANSNKDDFKSIEQEESIRKKLTAPSCCSNQDNQKNLRNLYKFQDQDLAEQQAEQNDDSQIAIMNFNTDWCFYSKKFQPIWNQFTEKMKGKNILVKDVKCDVSSNEDICQKYKVEGFPTVKLIKDKKVYEFNGRRTVDDLSNFVREHLN